MEGAVGLMAKVGMFKQMLTGFRRMACASRYKGCESALSDEALVEEGGE